MINILKLIAFLLVVLVTGCQQDKEDLANYVAEIQAQKKPNIEPIPELKPYKKFSYAAAELRDPFMSTVVEIAVEQEQLPVEDNGIRPNEHRLKEALELFELSELEFVGTLEQEDELSALIRASDGIIHRVQVGNYMGKNHGSILMISDLEITLKELIPDGENRYIEQESFLSVSDVN